MWAKILFCLILFYLLANPGAFKAMRKLLGTWVASAEGLPTQAGLLLHAFVFVSIAQFLPRAIMTYEEAEEYEEGEEYEEAEEYAGAACPSCAGCPGNKCPKCRKSRKSRKTEAAPGAAPGAAAPPPSAPAIVAPGAAPPAAAPPTMAVGTSPYRMY